MQNRILTQTCVQGTDTMRILSGTACDQFEATFFMASYAFLFPYSIGGPDLKFQARDRRKSDAPKVDFSDDWSKLLMQRAEAQFRRDLTLPFSLWNLVFRTVVNIGHNLYHIRRIATKEPSSTSESIDGTTFRDAALTVLSALQDTYSGPNGTKQQVNGDLQKARNTSMIKNNYVAGQMLNSLQATFRKVEGTQEVRIVMGSEISAYRVMYGVPIMVTFAPNEKHSTLIIRLSRVRGSDPLAKDCPARRKWGRLFEPELVEMSHAELNEHEQVDVNIEDLLGRLPDCETRKKIAAQDPLACVYGFHILCRIALATLFGVRVCPNCPDCNICDKSGCMDEFGSVALPEGGVYGRADAYYGSKASNPNPNPNSNPTW